MMCWLQGLTERNSKNNVVHSLSVTGQNFEDPKIIKELRLYYLKTQDTLAHPTSICTTNVSITDPTSISTMNAFIIHPTSTKNVFITHPTSISTINVFITRPNSISTINVFITYPVLHVQYFHRSPCFWITSTVSQDNSINICSGNGVLVRVLM